MFRITDNVTASHRATLTRAAQRLPSVGRQAQHVGMSHIHQKAVEAVIDAGHDPAPVQLFTHRGIPRLGLDHTQAGDDLADVEFGHPEKDPHPQPIIRTAAEAARPEANARYAHTLQHGLGLR